MTEKQVQAMRETDEGKKAPPKVPTVEEAKASIEELSKARKKVLRPPTDGGAARASGKEDKKRKGNLARERLTSAADLPTKELDWLFHPYLPLGSVVVLTGPPSVGKSSFVAAIAADVTGGPRLNPDQCPRQGRAALYFVQEEDPSILVKPRLKAAEADLPLVFFPDYQADGLQNGKLSLPGDEAKLLKWIQAQNAMFVTFDPINSFLQDGFDQNKTEHVRAVMDSLAKVAAVTSCLILPILHQRKSKEGEPLNRVAGSAAWVQAARMVLELGRHPTAPKQYVLSVTKKGIVKDAPSRFYTLEDGSGAQRFRFGDVTDLESDDLMVAGSDQVTKGKRELAMQIIHEELEDGPKSAKGILQRCRDLGIGDTTVWRAFHDLCCTNETRHEGGKNVTYWALPSAKSLE
jgi:DNA repair protein RadA/Sms